MLGGFKMEIIKTENLTFTYPNCEKSALDNMSLPGKLADCAKKNPEECEAGLEKIANYFKGDFSELRDIIALQPNNKVKALFGVRTTDDGKQYQAVYPKVLRANATDASVAKLDAEIQERKNAGALQTTEFTFGEFKEYTVEPTTFAPDTTTSDMPFAPDSPWG